MQQSPILAGAPLVWNQRGVRGWERSFKQMRCSLSLPCFSFEVVPHQSLQFSQLWQRRYHDTTDMWRCWCVWQREPGGGRLKIERKKEQVEAVDWRHLRNIHLNQSVKHYNNKGVDNLRFIPIIQLLYPLWGKVTGVKKTPMVRDETTPPWSVGRIPSMFRATPSRDNSLRSRWVNENRCFSAEEEQPPF